jgi:flagellin
MRINHNISAIFVNRQVREVSGQLDKSIERLSSGERIIRSGDDASGLAVSNKMRTQINGLLQAERNAQNGLSFIQVAEGSFQQINDMLQRVRALSVQSANGIYSNSDRVQIQVEVSQLVEEIDRISTSAEFNRVKLFTGVYAKNSKIGSMFFHVGANKDQRIRVYISTMSAKALNLVDKASKKRSIATVGEANSMIGYVDSALDKVNRQRANLGAYYNRMENTILAISRSSENLIAADSRVRDVDMAKEMVEYTKNKILLQTGIAMMSQANLKPGMLLKMFD